MIGTLRAEGAGRARTGGAPRRGVVRAALAASFECFHGLTPDVQPDQGDNRFNRGETYG